MKKLILLGFLISFVVQDSSVFAQWIQVSSGLGGLTVGALTVSGNNIYAGGTSSGVYVTSNNGANWTQTSLNNQIVFALGSNGNTIFAGTFNAGIFYSTNGGSSWTPSVIGSSMTVWAFVTNGSNNFAGTFCPIVANMGVYLSTNSGALWSQVGINRKEIRSMAINGSIVYAGSIDSGVYVSTNNGNSWAQTSLNNRNVRSMTVNGANVFAGCIFNNVGVYRSTNNGTTWAQTSLNDREVGALTINGNNVFAGTISHGIYVSSNNGVNWIQRNEGLVDLSVYSFCILNGYIYAGTSSAGVYRRPLSELLGIQSISSEIPEHFALSQNYPNPFNPATNINFQLPKSNHVKLSVFDLLGREAAVLVNEELSAGEYKVDFDGANFPSGIYYYKLQAGDFTETKKMILVK